MKPVISFFLSAACHFLLLSLALVFMQPRKECAEHAPEPPVLDVSFVKESDSKEEDDSAEPINGVASIPPQRRISMPRTELDSLPLSEKGDFAVVAPRADAPKIPDSPLMPPPQLDMPQQSQEGKEEDEDAQNSEPSVAAAASPAPKQARLDEAAKPSRKIVPRYPEEARRRKITGTVRIRMTIGVNGRAVSVKVAKSSGYKNLDKAAMEAVSKAEFTPARSAGRAVSSDAEIDIKFELASPRRITGR